MADPDKGWQLPEVVNPDEYWCYQIYVPKDVAYLRALRGAIGELAYNWNWQRDVDNTASQVVQNWLTQIIEADTIFNANEGECVDICAELLNCILTNADIQQAIANYSSVSNISSSQPENETNLAGQLINSPDGCDNDIIYGMTVQLVEFADRLIKDLLEGIKASNLSGDNIGFLIGAIPVVETLPIDELFELGYKLANDMEVAYLSASTELLKTEIACELFCIAQANDCVLTLEMVRDYFQTKADVVFSYDNPLSFAIDFITGVFVGNAVYYGMNILFFQIMAFGGKFLEYLFEDYLRVINSMFNDPNPDWATECDECPDIWEYVFDFSVDDGDFEPLTLAVSPNLFGTWTGASWSTQDKQWTISPTAYRRGLVIWREFDEAFIDEIDWLWDFSEGSADSNITMLQLRGRNGTSVVGEDYQRTRDTVASGSNLTVTTAPAGLCDNIQVLMTPSQQPTASYSGSASLKSITVRGTGFNPFD
jgi:hypothetical protein